MATLSGFEVIIGDQVKIWNYADLFPKGIYINKSVAATHGAWFKQLKAMGHQVVSWDEEGLLFFSSEMYKKLRLDEEALELVDLFFCWGDIQKNAILEWFPEYKDKIFVCGNPRFDLIRKDYQKNYTSSVNKLKSRYGNILLINTNFAFCNHFRSSNKLRNMLQSYPLASEEGYIDGWIKYQQQGFNDFYKIIPDIAKRYPDYTVIIRPHPSEDFTTWQRLAERHSNLVVNAEGNVHEWILASDVMLHDNCTTAIEAFILGVPPVSYRTDGGYKKYMNFLPDVLSCKVSETEALYKMFDNAIDRDAEMIEKIWCPENKKALGQYISGLDGQSSVEVILKHIAERMTIQVEKPSFRLRSDRFLKTQWRKILHKYREVRTPSDGYTQQKFTGMTAIEIADSFAIFNRIHGKQHQFCIKKITDSVYSIRTA
jgi:surface carbohydrate biosynthesis protein